MTIWQPHLAGVVDAFIYVIDVAEGDQIPRKRRSGNLSFGSFADQTKIDLAPHVGADLDVMKRDAKLMRKERPFLFTDLRHGLGVEPVVEWLEKNVVFHAECGRV